MLKLMFFCQLTLPFNNFVLTPYLRGIYLESWFSWLWGGVQKTLKKRRKQTEEKHWKVKRKKNEEYEESQITTVYKLVLNYILLKNKTWKEVVYTIKFYLQFLCVAGYLKHSNDTPNLNIHKYTNYNIIEIYINRLSTTTQIYILLYCMCFPLIWRKPSSTNRSLIIAMDYLTMMSEKYLYFRKRKKHLAKTFFAHPIEVTRSMYFGNIFRILCFLKICTNT